MARTSDRRPDGALDVGLAGFGLLVLWTVVGATWFLRTYLGQVTWDQVLFHLQHGGLDYADPRMLWRGFRACWPCCC